MREYTSAQDQRDSDPLPTVAVQWDAQLAQVGIGLVDPSDPSANDTGLWTYLDRPGVNRLIRLLRKAREASFGRDE